MKTASTSVFARSAGMPFGSLLLPYVKPVKTNAAVNVGGARSSIEMAKSSYHCRHCRRKYVPKRNGLAHKCEHCGKVTSKKTATRPQMVDLADDLFSIWVRYSASNDGLVQCITCRKISKWQDVDAGHFVPRGKWPTRYEPRNVHPQCKECNGPSGKGRQYEHGIRINALYGNDTAQVLLDLAESGDKQDVGQLAVLARDLYIATQNFNLDVSHIINRNRAASIQALGI